MRARRAVQVEKRSLVITGSIQGIGKALALYYLGRGDQVIAVGTSQPKGEALLAEADRRSAGRTFALYVLSRFLLVEELRTTLERALHPVIVNLCGT